MPRSTALAAPPPGAGRLLDMLWSLYGDRAQVGATIVTGGLTRVGAALGGAGAFPNTSVTGGGLGGLDAVVHRGRYAARVRSPTVSGGATMQWQRIAHPCLEQSPGGALDDARVFRFAALMAFGPESNSAPLGGIPFGPGLACIVANGSTGQSNVTTNIGAWLEAAGGGRLVVRTRKVAGAGFNSETTLPADTCNPADWNLYEGLLVSATATAHAELRWLVNRRMVWSRTWAPGTVLPDFANGAPNTGFIFHTQNWSLNTLPDVFVGTARVIVAPTEAATL